jgi:hypothetical protein
MQLQRLSVARPVSVLLVLMFLLAACGSQNPAAVSAKAVPPAAGLTGVQVILSGGHDTDPRDGGRPVVLIASALGVPPEVFRAAFSHVKPAAAGWEPNPVQVKLNKAALLSALGPYGITNDFLDHVSDYYRYNGSAGETWPQTPATAIAILTDGVVTGFKITNPGAGYTSAPVITVTGSNVSAAAVLSFGKDFKTNGSLAAITLNP